MEYFRLAKLAAGDQTVKVDLPELLAQAMERLELPNDEALAQRIGISQSAVSKWMQRKQAPRQSTWIVIAKKLDLDLANVAVAIANTEIVKTPSLAAQLRECREEVRRLELELAQRQPRPGGER